LVYPNPVVDQLRVDWKAELGDEVVLALYHISGKLVRTVAVEAKQIGHTFDLSDLPAGSYLLQVQYGAEGRLTYPILKQ
ncbi:MAG: T9SS type A sorting domain-containing protein, partial [Saprospiraceae bacterium]|nr:T9SS type A sorting domain-containing protein [Saprospiraceae bacterium]